LSQKFLCRASLCQVLLLIDQDLAAKTRAGGCGCGGNLHKADYDRKPRGGPEGLGPEHKKRFSFCCELDGCRKRATPPSVRFLGRRVYLGAVIVLVAVLVEGATRKRIAKLRALVDDVSERTIERWRKWWREHFPTTEFWREHGARFSPAVASVRLPTSLVERFARGGGYVRLVMMLRFLSPLTTAWRPPTGKK